MWKKKKKMNVNCKCIRLIVGGGIDTALLVTDVKKLMFNDALTVNRYLETVIGLYNMI
jgi:hypothetical protein